ncbi:MAG: fructose-6-phosphate aldolase [Firmicutes bacterium]|nr:fructose-6-phosphate aldolase [Bacillota bacterium]
MKIFLDTANIEEIKEANSWGIISGVTTNPSLIAVEGRDFKEVVSEICKIVNGPISAEAVCMEAPKIIEEARVLAKWHPNIVVKIPIMPEGLKAVKVLSSEGIKTNVTLVFSLNQAVMAALAGASFVSPFVGRIDDSSWDGFTLIRELVPVFDHYGFETEIIAASIRHPLHAVEAAKAGSHIATIPFKVLKQMITHPLTDIGIKRFLDDWAKVPKKQAVKS